MNCLNFNVAKEDYLRPVLSQVTDDQFYWAEGCISYILDNEASVSEAMNFYALKDPMIRILINMCSRLCVLNSEKYLPHVFNQKLYERFWSLEKFLLKVKPKIIGHSSVIKTLLLDANKDGPLSYFFDNSSEWSSVNEVDIYFFILATTGNDITCEEGARRWIQKCRGESLGCH